MSATMYGSTPGAGTGQAIFTDDVSLQVFMEHLKRLVSRYYAFSRVHSQCADISFFPRPLARRRIDFFFFSFLFSLIRSFLALFPLLRLSTRPLHLLISSSKKMKCFSPILGWRSAHLLYSRKVSARRQLFLGSGFGRPGLASGFVPQPFGHSEIYILDIELRRFNVWGRLHI